MRMSNLWILNVIELGLWQDFLEVGDLVEGIVKDYLVDFKLLRILESLLALLIGAHKQAFFNFFLFLFIVLVELLLREWVCVRVRKIYVCSCELSKVFCLIVVKLSCSMRFHVLIQSFGKSKSFAAVRIGAY